MTDKIQNLILFEAIQRDRDDINWPYRVTLEQTPNNHLFAVIEGSATDPGNSETHYFEKNPNPIDITFAAAALVTKYHLEEVITSNLYYRKPDEFSWNISSYLQQLEFALYGLSSEEFKQFETKLLEENRTYKRMADFFRDPESPENYAIFRKWEDSYEPTDFAPALDLESLLFPNVFGFNLDEYL
jgi:hypothetical protein